ncbi:MAG: acetyl-CoA carboxylase biotin carboxylase subunit [Anaerolineales bacterium]
MVRTKSISKLLIANRGEIAVRIARACRELGIRSVAVYSQPDAEALHARLADEAIEIGPAESSQSYLNIERVLAAAKSSAADALHAGYGFLAENADFAEAVIAAGLIWVGPPPAAMRAMGDKAGARALMEKVGVPVLPGYQGKDDPESLKKAARQIGYPLLVKASAGGGGMGQRVANRADELDEVIVAARRESQHAFGDGRLILEKYLPQARHVEIQVLGDQHGNLLHLFERECSLQRRRQKIVEESPSPLLDDVSRARIASAALTAAKAVGYANAGTVEFLVDPQSKKFYFLEMNTRIQVEHPVTELVTGIDLVQWQVRVAAGDKLSFKQAELSQKGHAIECRIYAEDPAVSFLPQAGRVLRLRLPAMEREAKTRIDSGVAEGDMVSSHYDPLLAKVIVHAKDRSSALQRMREAMHNTAILGMTTNIDFLQDLLAHKDVEAGVFDTRFVEREFADWQSQQELPHEALIAALLTELGLPGVNRVSAKADGEDVYSPWDTPTGFRIGGR